jgi:hypothetical protein
MQFIKIYHIEEILNIVSKLNGKVIIGFDWDNCISLVGSCYLPLRDPIAPGKNGDGTRVLQTFEEINRMDIPYFIITSRLNGLSIENISENINWFPSGYAEEERRLRSLECIKEVVRSMHEAVPELSPERINNPLPGLNPSEPLVISHKRDGNIYANSIIFENVIFAGSNDNKYRYNKGYAIINYMALGIIPSADSFDYFIFVDDSKWSLDYSQQAFEGAGIGDKLIRIWYPQSPLIKNTKLCHDRRYIDACLTSNQSP